MDVRGDRSAGPSSAFLSGPALWVAAWSGEQGGCRGWLHPHSGPVQHSCLYEPAEELLGFREGGSIAFCGGEKEAQQNRWVLEVREQQLNGQMGQLFSWEQRVGEHFCLDLESSLHNSDAVGWKGNLHHVLGVCSCLHKPGLCPVMGLHISLSPFSALS